jgi:hypothetical protein
VICGVATREHAERSLSHGFAVRVHDVTDRFDYFPERDLVKHPDRADMEPDVGIVISSKPGLRLTATRQTIG